MVFSGALHSPQVLMLLEVMGYALGMQIFLHAACPSLITIRMTLDLWAQGSLLTYIYHCYWDGTYPNLCILMDISQEPTARRDATLFLLPKTCQGMYVERLDFCVFRWHFGVVVMLPLEYVFFSSENPGRQSRFTS